MLLGYLKLVARYERLIEISRQLNSTLNIQTLLQHILKAATELTDCEEASLMLVDEASGELRFEAASQLSAGAIAAIAIPPNSIAGWIVTHAEPVLIEDASHDPRWYRGVDDVVQYHTRNVLGVPMIARNKVIGVLEALNKRGQNGWAEDDVTTLSTLASQAAIAIENTRLFHQNDLVSEIVHEFRAPLASLKYGTTLLERPDLPESKRTEVLHTLQSETERLSNLATNFLDLSRLQSGRAKIEVAKFNGYSLLRDSVESVRLQADAHGITIAIDCDSTLILEGDRSKLQQVMINLLTNAVKYNREQGRIMISAELTDEVGHLPNRTENVPMVKIAVADTGKGMSPENLKHMFERFFRASETANQQGTGLGLVIARGIVEAHGGRIDVDSTVNVGTTFTFTIPSANMTQLA